MKLGCFGGVTIWRHWQNNLHSAKQVLLEFCTDGIGPNIHGEFPILSLRLLKRTDAAAPSRQLKITTLKQHKKVYLDLNLILISIYMIQRPNLPL